MIDALAGNPGAGGARSDAPGAASRAPAAAARLDGGRGVADNPPAPAHKWAAMPCLAGEEKPPPELGSPSVAHALNSRTVCDRCVYDAAVGVGCKCCGRIRPVTVVPGMRPHRPRGRGAQRCPQSSSQEAAAANSPVTMLRKRGLRVFSEPGWLRGRIAPETAEYGLQPLLTAALGL